MSQESIVLKALQKAGTKGVPNYKFPEMRILCYTKRISTLRAEGHHIITERQQLPNGSYTGVYRYTLIEEPKKRSWFKK